MDSVFVFGGSSPIAIGISKHLQGKFAVIHFSRDVNQDCFKVLADLGSLLKEIDFMKLVLDPLYPEYLSSLFKEFSPKHVIFAQRSKEATLEKCLQVDVLAVQKIFEQFASDKTYLYKSAVLLTSPASSFIQSNQEVSYHVVKAAQLQLAKFYAANHRKYGVRTNCISPGAFVEKERSENFYAERRDLVERINGRIPIGRFARAQDVAQLTDFLISEASNYINGQEIFLDGGLSILDQSMFVGNT
jgi:hypothetical protein